MMTFQDRIAVVTGGAGRVGRPLCEKFAAAGVAVAVVDIDAEGAEAEAEKIRQGRIVNVGSIAGEVGLPFFGAYATSKAGVLMFTKTLAMEVAKRGVTVNCVSPGMIGDSPSGPIKQTWVERWGTGPEVADVIMFLSADDASFITGADYSVDGGRTLGPRFADV